MKHTLHFYGIAVTVSLCSILTTCNSGYADYAPKKWAGYLNPIHEKQYLNKSQDRVVKKKSFKANGLPEVAAIPNKEIGLFVQVTTSDLKDPALLQKLLEDKRTNGLSALIPWTLLEPTEEQYDWTPIDNLLAACKKNNKTLILGVSTCGLEVTESNSDTPEWLYTQGVKSISYKDKAGKDHKMPIFWDPVYLAKWGNFVKVLGEKYDKNPTLHSVDITGGGMLGGTLVVPDFLHDKANYEKLETELTKTHSMSQRQLVTHWKYVADLFPKAFPSTSLNFDIDPPTPNRAGQDTLDEISDYLVFRYGQRIYLTRQNVANGKHGFDEYRVILKFKNDTFTGYKLTEDLKPDDWKELSKNALNDGVSFLEIPKQYLKSEDPGVKESLDNLQEHLGYQLVLQSATIGHEVKAGEPIKASLSFLNVGSSAPKAARRQLDKDVPSSYQVGFDIRDQAGNSLLVSIQTPKIHTTEWLGSKPISWEDDYRLSGLKPGEYQAFLCVIDKQSKRRLQILDGTKSGAAKPEQEIALGNLTVQAQ